jgi:hypothetical protein
MRAYAHKIPVLSLVHRESGQCRSFVVDSVTRDALLPIVLRNVQRETYIMTDEATTYRGQFRKLFLGHGVVNHTAGEYGRGRVHTNTRSHAGGYVALSAIKRSDLPTSERPKPAASSTIIAKI